MEDEDESQVVSWNLIWVTVLVSVAQSAVFYGFFSYRRSKDASTQSLDLYEPRQFQKGHRSPAPFAEKWYKAAWEVSQEELLRCVGLDSFMFLRFLRLGARMAAVGTFLSIILIPTYATGKGRGNATLEFNQWTVARLESDSARLWKTVVCWWIFIGFILYELLQEWKLFAKNRYDFLATGDVDTPRDFRYSVRVEQLPANLQSNHALKEYFDKIFPNQVRQATVYLDIPELQKVVHERQTAIESIEAAVAFTKAHPDKPRPETKVDSNCMGMGGDKVDTIEHFTKEVERLNAEIDQRRAEILEQSAAIEQELDEEQAKPTKEDDSTKSIKNIASSTGIVTFSSLTAKQTAVQCEISGKADNMTVFPAADPDGILYDNVTVPLNQQRVLGLQASAVWIAGILFWAVPVAFVVSISNLNSILDSMGLDEVDSTAFWYGLVAGLLPVIALAILMAVLYMAIVAVGTHWIRFKSSPEVDAYTLKWHMLFQFANLWLILIGGSFFNQLSTLIDDPAAIVRIVADAMPGASVFFVNKMTVGGIASFGLELSNLPAYGVTMVMNLIQPEAQRTQRMLDDAKTPPVILWGQQIPPHVFVFLVTIMYMPIVPIMELFAFVYFAGTYMVFKHQCLHVYAPAFEGGGMTTWISLSGFLMACLYMGEFVFIAYMGLKEAPGPAACGFVPLVVTILVHVVAIRRNIVTPLQNLSLEVAARVDREDEMVVADESGDLLYGQPALKASLDEREPMPYRRDAKENNVEATPNKELEDASA